MTEFSFDIVTDADRPYGLLTGEIDLATADKLESAIAAVEVESEDGDVVVDMAGVTFIDSSGLRVLISSSNRQAGNGRRLVIRRPSAAVTRLLEITGLTATIITDS